MNIERLATSAVEESISKTDILDPFVKVGDKEPSWDGNVYIYADKRKTKKGIKKVPVQVKGELCKKFPPKIPPKYSVSLIDLENWLNDGGVFLFVVFISENGDEKSIFYNSLLPVKIRDLIKDSHGKKNKSIPLTKFPDDNCQKVTVLLNFYYDMLKQTSYARAPLFSMEELEKEGVLENVTFSITTYRKKKSECDIERALFQNDFYMYANIKGSSIPQPLPVVPKVLRLSGDIQGDITIGEQTYYHDYRVVKSVQGTEIHIGKSIVLKCFPDMNKLVLIYNLKGTLSDYIRDTECFIALLENNEISINGMRFSFCNEKKTEVGKYRHDLLYYRDVKKMLDTLGVRKDLECEKLSEHDKDNLWNLTNALIHGKKIGLMNCADTILYARLNIANLILLIRVDRIGNNDYRIQSFFDEHCIDLFEESDTRMEYLHKITPFFLLKKSDFLEVANIDYVRIKESLVYNDTSLPVMERLTLFMLEMLSAYDEMDEKDDDLLTTAEKYCDWLIKNSESLDDGMLLNRLQITRRRRVFNKKEIAQLMNMRKANKELSVRCAANLLLGKLESAQDCFDEMDIREKKRFISFPICHFGNLAYINKEEL